MDHGVETSSTSALAHNSLKFAHEESRALVLVPAFPSTSTRRQFCLVEPQSQTVPQLGKFTLTQWKPRIGCVIAVLDL